MLGNLSPHPKWLSGSVGQNSETIALTYLNLGEAICIGKMPSSQISVPQLWHQK
jgi:hypothetical protein